jgi:hypothetical protein
MAGNLSYVDKPMGTEQRYRMVCHVRHLYDADIIAHTTYLRTVLYHVTTVKYLISLFTKLHSLGEYNYRL